MFAKTTLTCRRVFDPFKIQLRICQPTGHASANGATLNSTQSKASARAKGLASQGQEIRLVVPEIGVMMDSREFEVLTDVISDVGMAQASPTSCHQYCEHNSGESHLMSTAMWEWLR